MKRIIDLFINDPLEFALFFAVICVGVMAVIITVTISIAIVGAVK